METKALKTTYKIEKEARELQIYNEYKELMNQPGAMQSAVNEYIMEKYSIYSSSTVWLIRKRVENRLKNL